MASFLTKSLSGAIQLVQSITASTGVADADKILSTDANGLIDPSFIPSSIANVVKTDLTAGTNLTEGQFVYIDASGVVQLADNSAIGTSAIGFVTSSFTSGATDVEVFFSGVNEFVTTTAGSTYFLDTAGGITDTPPAFVVGTVCQRLGVACDANELVIEIDQPIEYAAQ